MNCARSGSPGSRTIGAISLYSSEMSSYQDEHLRLLETISRIAALVVIDILSTAVGMRRPQEEQARVTRMKRQLTDMRRMRPL